ncbi:thioredoxin family protein [Blastopirellula sp. JC732]|uniref:Thioredoxin family protein n=1 Tax=Blastopirellula sediminis TaxID=2894196 RepID=A0A9X1MIX7_9BACT|nr:redoxin domain-containing protein [Blastopirellula sediminis]MCC9609285.1 thioredoxin family protein [Blastopirellula sediminis]MCC9627938.1 thioredoxin family protein [Blastopirellula sediminis]
MNRVSLLSVVVLASTLAGPLLARDSVAHITPIGAVVPDIQLKDFRGKDYNLADFADQKVVVLAFLGTECPLAKLYGGRLQELADEFAPKKVAIVGVMSNQHDAVTEIAAYARKHEISFPLLKDVGNRLADAAGAERTPEVVVLNADLKICYRGRIDDQYQIGVVRDRADEHELRDAIEALLAGKQVAVPATEAIGCHIGRVRQPKDDSEVTYHNQVARILQKRCVECHREGEIAPFALTDYDEVAGWAEMIAEVVEEKRMPPWHAAPEHGVFKNARPMPTEEKELLLKWVAAGAPEGDKSQAPKPAEYSTAGWTLPVEPDQVIQITNQPFKVPATGEVKYQYFIHDPGFTEDKWLQAAEIRPGNRMVVHHILAFAVAPGEKNLRDGGARGFLVGYVPGMRAEPFPEGMAKRVPAGSRLVFQVHYTPIGSDQLDQSELGLVFADPKEIKYEVKTTSAVNRSFRIPAGDGNYAVDADSQRLSTEGAYLLAMMPHMHLRGKSFRYELKGAEKNDILLDIPAYDFNWQTAYRLKDPLPLDNGSVIHCQAHFDNSKWNNANPDPTQVVKWGDQTWEEMMIGYFDVALPYVPGEKEAEEPADKALAAAKRLMERYDADSDGVILRTEVPEKGQRYFDLIDGNRDDKVHEDEIITTLKKMPILLNLIR